MLSITAKPFHPVHGTEMNGIIYIDGIPTCSFQGSDTEFLHSITDEAIDEAFPPSAQEAAELEAVEMFVEMMANLAHLEEKEEMTRFSEDHTGLGKRWMARRELKGKPRPAKHSINPVIHHHHPNAAKITDLVDFDAERFQGSLKAHRIVQRETERMARLTTPHKNKVIKNRFKKQMPIQQPRKQNWRDFTLVVLHFADLFGKSPLTLTLDKFMVDGRQGHVKPSVHKTRSASEGGSMKTTEKTKDDCRYILATP